MENQKEYRIGKWFSYIRWTVINKKELRLGKWFIFLISDEHMFWKYDMTIHVGKWTIYWMWSLVNRKHDAPIEQRSLVLWKNVKSNSPKRYKII